MTWTQSDTRVTLSCDGDRHQNDVTPMLGTAIKDGENALGATQRIWTAATLPGQTYTWTSSSTKHRCPSCTMRASGGNPQADW
jgi:hypothetical protein